MRSQPYALRRSEQWNDENKNRWAWQDFTVHNKLSHFLPGRPIKRLESSTAFG